MTPRLRRLAAAVIVLIALLFVGRWTVFYLAERWWAATISPAALAFVSRWQLFGLALDAGAIVTASAWFAAQALLVARVVSSVQITHRIGNLHLRESIPGRVLLAAAVTSGVALGLIVGAGAHAWRQPIALAWRGVTYGVTDPFLHEDLGTFVATLPVWDLVHHFVALLGVLGLALSAALYTGIGAIRREGRTIAVHPDARRHLGILLGFVALIIGSGYLLAPYHLAAAAVPSLAASSADARIHAAQIMAGVALATCLLSLAWTLRGRNVLLLASWIVLATGAVAERFVVPAATDSGPSTRSALAAARAFDAIAWGINPPAPQVAPADSTPEVTALWDEEMLARVTERAGSAMVAATPGVLATSGRSQPIWLVATSQPGDTARLNVLAIADGATTGAGAPQVIRSDAIADPRTSPGVEAWRGVIGGVPSGGPFKRLMLAWARQAPGMLRPPAEGGFDWHLDPTERAAAVLPVLRWMPADLVLVNSRPTWLVQGMIAIRGLPLATRATWMGEEFAGVTPVLLCTVDAASGETHFYLDPAADSLGVAWARAIGPLVAPSGALPPAVLRGVTYDPTWFQSQLEVLESTTWNEGRVPRQLAGAATPVPVWVTPGLPGRQMALEDPAHGDVVNLATAYRSNGAPQLRLDHRESDGTIAGSRAGLRQVWSRTPVMTHLTDSLAAAADSVSLRGIRWHMAGGVTIAWRPVFALPRHAPPRMLWITTAIGDRVGGGTTPAQAWSSPTAAGGGVPEGPDAAAALELARQWLQRADSAFRRGDMTAFGRAYEELRRTLEKRP